MGSEENGADDACNAWHPGLQSELPREYLPLATVFRPENVATPAAKARELSDYCGLPAHELVAFRAERLAVHELLVRVTAGLDVPDGTDYEDLGRNFREIASTILQVYIAPHRDELEDMFARLRADAAAVIGRELAAHFAPPAPAGDASGRRRWPFARRESRPAPPVHEPAEQREQRAVDDWASKARSAGSRLEQACFEALSTVATGVISRQGRLVADPQLLTEIAVMLVCNNYGSEAVGDAVAPFIAEAVSREGYRPLAPQRAPVVMNVKGASASGKSSMRPLQRILAKKLGVPWQDFALISPDIWRKFLLDYNTLGAAYKYAGTLTGHEIEIVDKKLDRFMASKASRGEMSHLLIDRFRFDSFLSRPEHIESSRLLTRFGDLVYMFFMITPPEMTVERAWTRGLKVGRYKAVEDLLAHNVEAFTGMPELFFTWALDLRRRVHYEFLDNSVPEGRPPRTVAFGWNGEMTILDIDSMLDIDRFRKINIHATAPHELYAGKDLAPERNLEFLRRCARLIPVVNFADQKTGRVYARLEHGAWSWRDGGRPAGRLDNLDIETGLAAIVAGARDGAGAAGGPAGTPGDLDADKLHTLGAWGDGA